MASASAHTTPRDSTVSLVRTSTTTYRGNQPARKPMRVKVSSDFILSYTEFTDYKSFVSVSSRTIKKFELQ